MLIGLLLCLVGGALMETPIIGYLHHENGLGALLFGIFCGALFFVPGIAIFVASYKEWKKDKQDTYWKDLLTVLDPSFKEAKKDSLWDSYLISFRNHYSEFFEKEYVEENEKIQKDVTQIFRNMMQLRKNRLKRLGLTCEMLIRRMQYTNQSGLYTYAYSDGKYNICDIQEEVAAKTIYKKDGKEIYTKQDKELANYTVLQAVSTGANTIICPNCGNETTREALLDGCDYCGTRFMVEDLGRRIAVFAFRPNKKLRNEKYLYVRNRVISILILIACFLVFISFTVYGIKVFPDLLETAEGGILLTLLGEIFALLVSTPVYIVSFILVYAKYILPIAVILIFVGIKLYQKIQTMKDVPMLSVSKQKDIQEFDPNFSITGFYSNVQNKLSSLVFADTKEQMQAFAQKDLTYLLGKYNDVVGMDVDTMEIEDYHYDSDFQYVTVSAVLILTRYNGKWCSVRKERVLLDLIKSVHCKTEEICAPAVLVCKGCGASIDLTQGKACLHCGKEVDFAKVDWVIWNVKRGTKTTLNEIFSK